MQKRFSGGAHWQLYTVLMSTMQNTHRIPHMQFTCADKPLYGWYTHGLYSGICSWTAHNLVIHILNGAHRCCRRTVCKKIPYKILIKYPICNLPVLANPCINGIPIVCTVEFVNVIIL